MPEKRVILTDEISGKSLELPVVVGTEGDPTLDISNLRRQIAVMRYGELRWKEPRVE